MSEVVENLLTRLVVKHRFTTMYKPNTNGLIERTNRTLCSMLAKKVKVHVNICDWDFKIHHVVWVYNTTYKIATGFSPFHLTYGMEMLLPIELEVMTFMHCHNNETSFGWIPMPSIVTTKWVGWTAVESPPIHWNHAGLTKVGFW